MPAKKDWLKGKEVTFTEDMFSKEVINYLESYDKNNIDETDIWIGSGMRLFTTTGIIGNIIDINTTHPMSITVKLSRKLDEVGVGLDDIKTISIGRAKNRSKSRFLCVEIQ